MATDTTTETPVLSERRGSVMLITLNRPDRLNAWNVALEEGYFSLLDEAEDDTDVRAVVVTGAGRGFCAGADMDDLARIGERGAPSVTTVRTSRARPAVCVPQAADRRDQRSRRRASGSSRRCTATCASAPRRRS